MVDLTHGLDPNLSGAALWRKWLVWTPHEEYKQTLVCGTDLNTDLIRIL